MDQIGIELLSVFGLPPVQFVDLAADLGCHCISTGLVSLPFNPHGYPAWSLRDNPVLRNELVAAMGHRGVSISLGEGIGVRPNKDVRDSTGDLHLMCELGVRRINAVSTDPDLQRTLDQYATLAEMSDALDLEMTIEFGPVLTLSSLAAALAAIRHVGRKNVRLLIDVMHLVRSGSGAADLAALDPDLIGYVQLCDVPLVSTHSTYMQEAMFDRKLPGAGELPLIDILAVLPSDRVFSLEVPMLAQAEAGIGPHQRLQPGIESARRLLAAARARAV